VALGLAEWSPVGTQGVVYDMTMPDEWDRLASDYTHQVGDKPLFRIFEIAQSLGVTTIVKEPRYIDADWRSQLARFYNGTFRRYPSVCHRLHFFTRAVPQDLADLSGLQDAYRGYAVLRPLTLSPVGKTMIMPPPEMSDAVQCRCTESVDLFGWKFNITAMPFISQDTQFLRCAHASLWMVLAHARFAHDLPRQLPSDIHDAAIGGVMVGRQLPSDGLSGYQLFSAMTALGLSPTMKPLQSTSIADENAGILRLHGMICRYINSGLPPIVISNIHAWVVVAYARRGSTEDPTIQLWRHDDARGPYMPVSDPWSEPELAHQPWVSVYLPLLPKAFVDAERAEIVGRTWINEFAKNAAYQGTTLETANCRTDMHDHATFRTYLIRSSDFKQGLSSRGMPQQLAITYRLAAMPRYIWVIEIVDRMRRRNGEADVLGELLLDATLTQFEPLSDPASVLALHVDNFAFLTGVDQAPATRPSLPVGTVYESGCAALRA
jgi:hypothetical protein